MPKSDDQIADEIVVTLLRVLNKIQQGRRVSRHYGDSPPMTMVEAEMCQLISRQDGVTGAELSEQLGVTRSATSQVIAKLKAKGFVSELTDSNDAKRKQLSVTPLGKDAADVATGYAKRMSDELFNTSRKELESYHRFFTKLEAFHERFRAEWDDREADVRRQDSDGLP